MASNILEGAVHAGRAYEQPTMVFAKKMHMPHAP